MSITTINKQTLLLIGGIILVSISPVAAKAQLADIISDYVEDYIEREINNYFRSSASNLWDNFVDYSARASLAEESKKLSDFQTASHPLSAYSNNNLFIITNGQINTDATLMRVKDNTISQFNVKLYSTANIPFNQIGNGSLATKCNGYLNQVEESHRIKSLNEVLNSSVIHTIASLDNPNLANLLLDDINKHPGLIPTLNNAPGAIDFYCKLIGSDLRTNSSELLYWASLADFYRPEMPRKTKLINPLNLTFELTPDKKVVIIYNQKKLAIYSPIDSRYNVLSPEFLNFSARPNHEYYFESLRFLTDELGRVQSINFYVDKKKNKTNLKNPVKFNDIAKALTGNTKNNLYDTLLKKYNVVAASSFAITVVPDDLFKKELKRFNKTYKKSIKSHYINTLTLRLTYNGASDTPTGLVLCPNSDTSGFKLH